VIILQKIRWLNTPQVVFYPEKLIKCLKVNQIENNTLRCEIRTARFTDTIRNKKAE